MRILHADGYVDVSGMAVFNYQLKDHLGNVRPVIGRSYGPGAYTLSQASDYYPFGMAFTWNAANSEEETYAYENKYKYNGKEEQPMPGKWLDYGARFYDAQLGRWHSVDPLAEKYESFSSYVYALNNPINLIDPFGLDVVNADKKKKEEAERKKKEAEAKRKNYKGDSRKEIRKLDRAVKKANRNFNSANAKFQKTEMAIDDLKKYNPELFDKLNNLEDPGGQCVDVYIETVDDLKTNYFGNNTEFSNPEEAMGLTQTKILQDHGYYYSVRSKSGLNSVSIALNSNLQDPGFTLSHEGGHVSYNVAFFKSLINWLNTNPGKSKGGHGGGNLSGIEAQKQEKIYRTNRKKKAQ